MAKASQKRGWNDKTENANKKHKGHWSMGLLNSLDDPELFIQADDLVTVIKDKYPKAEKHFLVVPKENVSSLKAVSKKHLSLLKHMDDVANELCQKDDCKGRNFKIGYHAEPSMVRLHLHVISDDMNSPCLKSKKHWNSFNTDFFLESKGGIIRIYKICIFKSLIFNFQISVDSLKKMKKSSFLLHKNAKNLCLVLLNVINAHFHQKPCRI